MACKVIIKEQAKDDTQAAYDHYESQLQHLGEEFLAELAKRYKDIAEHPTHYGFIDKSENTSRHQAASIPICRRLRNNRG